MKKWQPIATAPKDGTNILIPSGYGRNRHTVEGYWRRSEDVAYRDGWVSCIDPDVPTPYLDPDVWMPLPEPPKEA
ncbi:hypothetical protein LCGC14_1346750 [marine sediment metagenome]|uniref:DUF551 domain-containing protein n=1 Tax=marine sediment metagenome TaxID=412755 RepID=A0A0F9KY48_9ZZZZ